MKTINTGSFAFVATMFVALSATAGIKYWDNPAYRAYDVDCYVQDGLVLNYDGIRNAGPDADHDPDATTWKNLGTGGATYDMVQGGTAANSGWTDGKGFHFAGDAFFKSGGNQALPEYYEIQTLVDAKASDHTGIGYIYTRRRMEERRHRLERLVDCCAPGVVANGFRHDLQGLARIQHPLLFQWAADGSDFDRHGL